MEEFEGSRHYSEYREGVRLFREGVVGERPELYQQSLDAFCDLANEDLTVDQGAVVSIWIGRCHARLAMANFASGLAGLDPSDPLAVETQRWVQALEITG